MQMTRVLFFCSDILGHRVFGERHVAALQAEAPDMELTVLGPAQAYAEDAVARWTLRVLGRPGLPPARSGPFGVHARLERIQSLCARRAVRRAQRRRPINVVHLHTQSYALCGLPGSVPWIASLDATSALLARLPGRAGRHEPSARLERRVLPQAHAVVAWSHWAADSVIHDCGCEQRRVHVIPPAVPCVPCARTERDGKPVRVLFVGNDFRRKGGDQLLEAMRRLPPGLAEIDVVSNDPAASSASANVRVHRGLRHDAPALTELFAAADLFALPTLEECYGIAISEAMASGLPVVVSDVMAVPSFVGHGREGFLVPPGDVAALAEALLHLAQDPGLRAALGEAAWRRAATEASPGVTARRWAELYRNAHAQ